LLEESTLAKLKNGEKNISPHPNGYALQQNHPNPFNPTTTISYSLPVAGNVNIVVTNLLGKEIRTLVNDYKEAGEYGVTFDASELPSGVYMYSMTANGTKLSRRMTLTK
jgi:hypothetical protein